MRCKELSVQWWHPKNQSCGVIWSLLGALATQISNGDGAPKNFAAGNLFLSRLFLPFSVMQWFSVFAPYSANKPPFPETAPKTPGNFLHHQRRERERKKKFCLEKPNEKKFAL